MQLTSYLVVFSLGLLAPLVAAAPAELQDRACVCTHNSDAGRWIDETQDPYGAVNDIHLPNKTTRVCTSGSTQRFMCLEGDPTMEKCLKDTVRSWQSYHGDWFIWTRIDCGGLHFTLQAN